ncbi:hypothetical protein PR048_009885 [Dryococelus australis]|uniref:DUF4371 domain-containing protein n=1 Tax=Dryococelus australis TaxID=614101 RepID=A0ABQ9I1K8_9NEOP|nr:hypothetical protein PR048_009885 [Dryococelus australis]
MKGRGKLENPEKTRRPTHRPARFPHAKIRAEDWNTRLEGRQSRGAAVDTATRAHTLTHTQSPRAHSPTRWKPTTQHGSEPLTDRPARLPLLRAQPAVRHQRSWRPLRAPPRPRRTTAHKKKKGRDSSSESDDNHDDTRVPQSSKCDTGQPSSSPAAPVNVTTPVDSSPSTSEQAENDLDHYVGIVTQLSVEKELLENSWVPPRNYDFATDESHMRRKFNNAWLDQYVPWLVYSKRLKGAVCKHCVLFPPVTGTVTGVSGSFLNRPYKIQEYARRLQKTCYQQPPPNCNSYCKGFFFSSPKMYLFTSNCKVVTTKQSKKTGKYYHRLFPYFASHMTCLLREKRMKEFVEFTNRFWRQKLKSHLEKCRRTRRNAVYTSPKIQNELIVLFGKVIRENIKSDTKKFLTYVVLADETADIAGKEQLSMSLRYNLSPDYCISFGFDGCSTIAGKEGGVQAILRKTYFRALFFHCSSYKLNLVVNDANQVLELRNTIATIKNTINFSGNRSLEEIALPIY